MQLRPPSGLLSDSTRLEQIFAKAEVIEESNPPREGLRRERHSSIVDEQRLPTHHVCRLYWLNFRSPHRIPSNRGYTTVQGNRLCCSSNALEKFNFCTHTSRALSSKTERSVLIPPHVEE